MKRNLVIRCIWDENIAQTARLNIRLRQTQAFRFKIPWKGWYDISAPATSTWATEWLPALGLRQMINWIKARWTGIICALLGHKRIPLTQYQDGFFLWACERCGCRDWEFAPRNIGTWPPKRIL
jgi:hypothetical protein